MPSRINIGPENGPFVAINENNGDIELEDNTGAVVAKWDDGQSQWDFVENDISGVGAFDSESVNTESINIESTYHYAGSDEDLDAVLSNASSGDVVILGLGPFSDDRTIDERVVIRGTESAGNFSGTEITGEWTITDNAGLEDLDVREDLSFDSRVTADGITMLSGTTITITGDECLLNKIWGGNVVFDSNTEGGLIDTSVGVSITDNGANTVGDIA